MAQRRSILTSPRLEERRRRRRRSLRIRMFITLGILFAIVASFVYVSRLPRLNIRTVDILGNKILDSDELASRVEADIAGRYLWLFPRSNFLIYPRERVKRDLLGEYKRIAAIDVSLKNTDTLDVTVSERQAAYAWCGTSVAAADSTCYFMDDAGYIFDQSPYFSGDVFFRLYGAPTPGPDSAPGSPLGSTYLPGQLGAILSFRDLLVGLGLRISGFESGTGGDMAFYLDSGAAIADSPRILWKSDADQTRIAENLKTALDTDPLATEFKKKYADLAYIDLRFGDKVYYKFNGPAPAAAAAAAPKSD